MTKKHIEEIDALKGWAIFLVVLGHSIIVYPINLHENAICNLISSVVNYTHMHLFFFVSGFCFSYRNNYKEYILKKVKRLIVPYFAFCLIEMVAKILFSGIINRPRSISEFLIRMFFYGGDYWFLWTLFIIFLFYPWLSKLMSQSKWAEMIGLLCLLVVACIEINITLFRIGDVARFLFWFAAGERIRRRFSFEKKLLSRSQSIVVFLLFLALCVCISLFYRINSDFEYNCRYFIGGITGVAFSLALSQLNWFNRVFAKYGTYSLQIYLLNGLFLGISRTLICSVLGVTLPAAIIVFNMMIDFFVSYFLIKNVFSRIAFARFLMGM